jgi:uncharacterized protein (TIGR03437 family)
VIRAFALALFAGAIPLPAQPPAIGQNGVVNTASQIPSTLPGGALAPGSLFTAYGVRFGTSNTGVKVTLQRGQTKIAAKVVSVRPKRIDAWLPRTVPPGPALITVEVNGASSDPFHVQVIDGNPGLFSTNGEGWGPGLFRKAESPAHVNQRVSLLGTGFSATRAVTIVVGNRAIQAHRPRETSQPGQQEITFTVPVDSPLGCYVPVYALATPRRASNVVTISIAANDSACDPGPLPILSADRIGVAVFARSTMRARQANLDNQSDEAIVAFSAKSAGPVFSPLLLLPPAGACTVYTSSFQADSILPNSISAAIVAQMGTRGLRAGNSLTFTNGAQSRTIPQDGGTAGYYRASLGNSDARRRIPLFLQPGEVTLSGSGGPDIGPFSAKAHLADPFEWIDREAISQVTRDRPLTVHWSGLANDRRVAILATNVDQITTAMATTLCTARATDQKFTIPAAVLANVPASRDIAGVPYDQLFVMSLPEKTASAIQAKGLDRGAIISLQAIGRFVTYR